ncbi:MAG TPA: DinB family protein [Steroidobacteraceae bacterium]|jgi:hypothetical protein
MQYMKLCPADRAAVFESLVRMPQILRDTFSAIDPETARTPGPNGLFSPVEQVWHLADLEREGFGVRIQKLRTEPSPFLPDFDGDAIAAQRNYQSLSLREALMSFEASRAANLDAMRGLSQDEWLRTGTQEGVGSVGLCDLPVLMLQHDQAHLSEIEQWRLNKSK